MNEIAAIIDHLRCEASIEPGTERAVTLIRAADAIEMLQGAAAYAANIMDFMSDHHGNLCEDCEDMHKDWIDKYVKQLPSEDKDQ